ncbi:MAG: hypothetical protein LBN94_00180, partial [Puniceicoccales bacterium]|nr:hypothetical protein [Puniceicoccales bacterium]
SAALLLFNATKEMGSEQILLALNPHFGTVHFDTSLLGNAPFVQIADTFSFTGSRGWPSLWQGNRLELTPLSCTIWKRM